MRIDYENRVQQGRQFTTNLSHKLAHNFYQIHVQSVCDSSVELLEFTLIIVRFLWL